MDGRRRSLWRPRVNGDGLAGVGIGDGAAWDDIGDDWVVDAWAVLRHERSGHDGGDGKVDGATELCRTRIDGVGCVLVVASVLYGAAVRGEDLGAHGGCGDESVVGIVVACDIRCHFVCPLDDILSHVAAFARGFYQCGRLQGLTGRVGIRVDRLGIL
mmetsp:Transcript_54243/g.82200  ORF Transcript_54243/g.82200 Transcript_54243/m.82200 type:complete len:158 (+) Transcript_54243:290-763(+)